MAEYFSGSARLNKTPIKWTSVFPKGFTHNCERCGLCCTLVHVNQKDLQRLNASGSSSLVTEQVLGGTPRKVMKTRENGTCAALNKDWLCDIYEARPMICRSYPFLVNPGMDGKLVIDISMGCPYVGLFADKKIESRDLKDAVGITIDHIPETLRSSMSYRKTLADHLRAAFPPAFLSESERLEFMDAAISYLVGLEDPCNIISESEAWGRGIAGYCRSKLSEGGNFNPSELKGALSLGGNVEKPSKKRCKLVFGDIGNRIFFLGENGVEFSNISAGFLGVRIGGTRIPWRSFEKMAYSKAAIEELASYMKICIRRPGFQVTSAKIANYLVDYEGVGAMDHEISSVLLSRALVRHFDPIARSISGMRGDEKISGEDARLAICNMDNIFLTALMSGSLANDFVRRIRSGELTSVPSL
jgi:Fe-S-cluster containining protein